jgi:hypothetical protein
MKTWNLHSVEKIKDPKVMMRVVLNHFHMVMFMSINTNETIESFTTCGKEMVENFDNLLPSVAWTKYF